MFEDILQALIIFSIIFAMIFALYGKQIRKGQKGNAWLMMTLMCLLVAGLVRQFDRNLDRQFSKLLLHVVGLFGFSVSLYVLSKKANKRMRTILDKQEQIMQDKAK